MIWDIIGTTLGIVLALAIVAGMTIWVISLSGDPRN